jgi:DNA-binding winged helix-turn-helix (wHTH) protein
MISMNTELVTTHSPDPQGSSNVPAIALFRYARFGIFQLDLQKEELFKEGVRVKLQGKVFQVLVALIEKPGEVVTREALCARLWPGDTHVNYDANVNTTVNKLRQVLGDSPEQPVFVDTIPRKGYSFVASVEFVNHPASQEARPQEKFPPETMAGNHAALTASLLRAAFSSKWFTAGVISLVLGGMLFGAALVLYAHRAF